MGRVEEGEVLLADGFEEAFLGFGRQFCHEVAVYDYHLCLDVLQHRDGMSWEEAHEFFEFNVVGAWVGPNTPVFIDLSDCSLAVQSL